MSQRASTSVRTMNGQDAAANQERGEEPPVAIIRRSVEARM
jgi:hypothetical protein